MKWRLKRLSREESLAIRELRVHGNLRRMIAERMLVTERDIEERRERTRKLREEGN